MYFVHSICYKIKKKDDTLKLQYESICITMMISSLALYSFVKIHNVLSVLFHGSKWQQLRGIVDRSLSMLHKRNETTPALISAFYHPYYRHYLFSQRDTNSRARGIYFNRIAKYISLSIIA